MQEIAKYILKQIPKLDDFELDQIASLITTIQVSRKIRKPHKDNPLLKHGVGYAKGFPKLEGDWVVNTDTDKPM